MGLTNPLHLAFIAAIALIVLGPKRLPDVARSLGRGMREFREALQTGTESHDAVEPEAVVDSTVSPPPQAAAPAAPTADSPAQPAAPSSVPADPPAPPAD